MALQNYETVAQRLERFWTDHPSGRVFTELIEGGSGYWVFRGENLRESRRHEPDLNRTRARSNRSVPNKQNFRA
jgi:hypothetical protein